MHDDSVQSGGDECQPLPIPLLHPDYCTLPSPTLGPLAHVTFLLRSAMEQQTTTTTTSAAAQGDADGGASLRRSKSVKALMPAQPVVWGADERPLVKPARPTRTAPKLVLYSTARRIRVSG